MNWTILDARSTRNAVERWCSVYQQCSACELRRPALKPGRCRQSSSATFPWARKRRSSDGTHRSHAVERAGSGCCHNTRSCHRSGTSSDAPTERRSCCIPHKRRRLWPPPMGGREQSYPCVCRAKCGTPSLVGHSCMWHRAWARKGRKLIPSGSGPPRAEQGYAVRLRRIARLLGRPVSAIGRGHAASDNKGAPSA